MPSHDLNGNHLHLIASDVHLPFRLAVGLGDATLERRFLDSLPAAPELTVAARCLTADAIEQTITERRADVVLVSTGLHKLGRSRLLGLIGKGLPVVLLSPRPAEHRGIGCPVLPSDASFELLRETLLAAARGKTIALAEPAPVPIINFPLPDERKVEAPVASLPAPQNAGCTVFTVTSGTGSAGRSTVAIALAAALGRAVPTALVDLDFSGPDVAAWLDLATDRNIYQLARFNHESEQAWDSALEAELQPLDASSRHAVTLCGLPTPEARALVPATFVEALIANLRRHYTYVVIDVGAELLGMEPHRVAVQISDQVVLVARTDFVGLYHARTALQSLEKYLGIPREQVALVLNCHDRRRDHNPAAIEWALKLPAAAVIPYDRKGAQAALAARRPLLGASGAGKALLQLAEKAHGDRLKPPLASREPDAQAWDARGGRRWLPVAPWARRERGDAPTVATVAERELPTPDAVDDAAQRPAKSPIESPKEASA